MLGGIRNGFCADELADPVIEKDVATVAGARVAVGLYITALEFFDFGGTTAGTEGGTTGVLAAGAAVATGDGAAAPVALGTGFVALGSPGAADTGGAGATRGICPEGAMACG